MRLTHTCLRIAITIILVASSKFALGQNPLADLPSPGNVYTNQQFGTSPSAAEFNNELWIAYKSNANNALYLTWSSDGTTFSTPFVPNSVLSAVDDGTAPAIATYSGQLWVAFSNSGLLFITSTSDGVNFAHAQQVIDTSTSVQIRANGSPTLTVYNGELWLGVVQNGSGSATAAANYESINPYSGFVPMNVCSGGATAPNGEMPQTGSAIGMSAVGGNLWFGYQTQGGYLNHNFLACVWNGSSASYVIPTNSGVPFRAGGGVSAASLGTQVYFFFKNYSNHDLIVLSPFGGFGDYSGIAINGNQQINPGATVFNGHYYVAYTQNNSGHHMYVTHD